MPVAPAATTTSKSGSPFLSTATDVTECAIVSLFTSLMTAPCSRLTDLGEYELANPPGRMMMVAAVSAAASGSGDERSTPVSWAAPNAAATTATTPSRLTPINATGQSLRHVLARAPEARSRRQPS